VARTPGGDRHVSAPARRGLAVLLLLVLAPAALADEPPIRGAARVDGWRVAPRGGEARDGMSLRTRLDLSEPISLDLSAARDLDDADAAAAAATLALWDFRISGGVVGEDAALRVAWAPVRTWRPADWLEVEGGLDLGVGAGWLSGHPTARRPRGAWREVQQAGLDLVAASLGTHLALTLRPWRFLALRAGGWGHALVVGGPPRDARAPGLSRLTAAVDVGPAAALSYGGFGAWGGAELDVVDLRRGATRLRLTIGARTAWDRLIEDGAWSVVAVVDPWDEVEVELPGWRQTHAGWVAVGVDDNHGASLALRLEARHVTGSTTWRDPADRDGVSFGASLLGRLGRVEAEVGAQHALGGTGRERRLEALLGKFADTTAYARAGVTVYDGPVTSVALEAHGETGVSDDWGLTREGWGAGGGLRVEFGGSRRRQLEDVGRPPLPRPAGPPSAALVDALAANAPAPARPAATAPAGLDTAGLTPEQLAQLTSGLPDELLALDRDDLRRAGMLDGKVTPEDVSRLADANPDAAKALDDMAPGLLDLARTVRFEDPGSILSASGGDLVAGWGPSRGGVGLTWGRGGTLTRGLDLATPGAEGDDDDEELLALDALSLSSRPLLDVARDQGWAAVTVGRQHGERRYEVLWQGSSGWARAMRGLLGGRPTTGWR
jgi:hypothetical protein